MLRQKIINIAHGFIEPLGRGEVKAMKKRFIGEGSAVNAHTAYRRLIKALRSDDFLLSSCIKEAESRGHKILF